MENDEIQYIIKNSTFIKNNLLNKVDDNLNLLMIIFVILNEEDKNKKKKNLLSFSIFCIFYAFLF